MPGGGFPGNLRISAEPRPKGEALKEFVSSYALAPEFTHCLQSLDLTEMARAGKLDPTIGRDEGRCFVTSVLLFTLLKRSDERFKVSAYRWRKRRADVPYSPLSPDQI